MTKNEMQKAPEQPSCSCSRGGNAMFCECREYDRSGEPKPLVDFHDSDERD